MIDPKVLHDVLLTEFKWMPSQVADLMKRLGARQVPKGKEAK